MQFLNRRAIASYFLIVCLVALMTGCGNGGESSADKKAAVTVTQVDIFPNPSISLTPGQVTQVFAQALNSSGAQVFTQTITFSSSSSSIDITPTGGLLCAGKWDNLTTPVVCNPAVIGPVPPNPTGTPMSISSNITASAGGVTSPTTVASIHLPVTSIVVTPSGTPSPSCVQEAGTQLFKAVAYNGPQIPANDITTSVGSFNWQSTQTGVATIPSGGDTGFTDQATATAVHPGNSNIIASIGTVAPITSTPVVFTQCLVGSILVEVGSPDSTTKTPPEDSSHFTVATGATRALTVTVKDTTGTKLTTLPTLNWNTTHPAIATVGGTSTGATVSGVAAGTVGISASCLPNNCNIGTNVNVTSNLVSGTVTGTPSTSSTGYVTCIDPVVDPAHTCTTSPSAGTTQTQLFPINGTTLGTAINLPHTPNSMMINPQNSRLYLGSAAGLMVVDAAANSFSSTVTNAPGKVLAVAPNGNAVVVSSDNDVFIYNGSTVITLLNGATHVVGATAAAFSPDSGKLVIATSSGQVWFEVSGTTPTKNTDGSFASAAFFPSGSLQAVSTNGNTRTYDLANAFAGIPTPTNCGGLIAPMPNLDALYAADAGGTACVIDSTLTSTTFGIGAFSATEIAFSPDGTHAFLIGGGQVVDNTVGTTTKALIDLGAASTTGGVATNGTLYVGSADNKVHVITFPGAADTPITTAIPADLVVAKH